MGHFGITPEKLMKAFGLSQERMMELARNGWDWALPNITQGSFVILPIWLLFYLFQPPRTHDD
jgi:hypothetical protein